MEYPKRNKYIDSIKGICILCILTTHFSWDSMKFLKSLFPFWIDMAVPSLMVISGYLSASSLKKSKYTFHFLNWLERFHSAYFSFRNCTIGAMYISISIFKTEHFNLFLVLPFALLLALYSITLKVL